MQVIKRDGTKVAFDISKIAQAVEQANSRIKYPQKGLGEQVGCSILAELIDYTEVSITKIEDIVEATLKKLSRETYREYASYRQKRMDERFVGTTAYQQTEDILIGGRDERENGNLDENTFSGKNSKIASTLGQEYTRSKLISKDVLEAYDKGALHIHDINNYHLFNHNCTTIDLETLLNKGFKTKNGGVRKPKSIRAALDLTYLLIGTISQNQFGGCAVSGFDTCLAPYLGMSYTKHFNKACGILDSLGLSTSEDTTLFKKAEDIAWSYTKDELYQAMEGFFHNLSTAHTREANQLSFSSINYGNDTSSLALMISKCVLETRAKGIGPNKEIPIFPIGIFQYSPKLHGEGKPLEWLFDMAVESTSKNIYPNYVYVPDSSADLPWRAKEATMGCRTQNGIDRFAKGVMDRTGRGNISPVTLNLPYIALSAKGNSDLFYTLLYNYLQLSEKALVERYSLQVKQKGKNAPFLYENNVLKSEVPIGPEDCVEPALKHGSLVFGYIGLAEALVALTGKHHGEDKEAYKLGKEILEYIKKYAEDAGNRNNLNMSLYATPAESLCMKARNKTVNEFGIVHNITDRAYFTNSHHLPVYFNITASEKIKLEAPLAKLATAGNILYNELTGDASNNIKAVKSLVREAMAQEVPYFALNIPRDTCNVCGFKGYDLESCPSCGSKEIKLLRRITGYTTSEVKFMNDGKQAEVKDRVKHASFNAINSLCG